MRPTPPTAWLLLSQGRAVTWPSLQRAHGCGPRLSFLGPTLPVAIAPRDWPGPLAAAVPLGLLLGPATQVVPVVDVTEAPGSGVLPGVGCLALCGGLGFVTRYRSECLSPARWPECVLSASLTPSLLGPLAGTQGRSVGTVTGSSSLWTGLSW